MNLSEITINEQTLMAVSTTFSVSTWWPGPCQDLLLNLTPVLQAFSTVRDKMAQRILQG